MHITAELRAPGQTGPRITEGDGMSEKKRHEISDTELAYEEDNAEENAEKTGRGGFRFSIHYLFLLAFVLIVGIIVFALYRWNKGVPSDYDPNYHTTEFDVEVIDNIIPLAPDKREGYVDDGVTTILCLGDDPFSLNRGPGGLSEQIEAKTGAVVYNGAFTGTTVARQNADFAQWCYLDAFSFVNVAQSLASGDFGLMKEALAYSYDEAFPETVELLSEEVDMNKVDILCIMYDGSDYVNKRAAYDPSDPYNPVAYTGALRTGIEAIQNAYPHIRIAVLSHTFCHCLNDEGGYENGDRTDLGNGTLSHYWQLELDVTMDCSVSFIDNFYGSVNEDNYLDYMTDYIHFNDAGRELLAERFVECILPSSSAEAESD